MKEFYYVQLNKDNICVGISNLSGDVEEYNYKPNITFNPITEENIEGEPIFISRMIPVSVYSENYVGLHYNEDGTWNEVTEQ